jgi:hypothetical protein
VSANIVDRGCANLAPAAFSSEAETGSPEENASNESDGASVLIQ